ncbi:MAG: hypothetical protein COA71_11335 [SAR86 cluster bacterium]|uniref:Glycosyl transferase family 1 domain-containing protein n=1 Tax=SAR86 cluster bacterium TaxID=2030880 RepID=A0A2A5CAH3_9GAMM|nr:MAG: hypothetical protein COA71_11335 [SAR86 cluster bacterium]
MKRRTILIDFAGATTHFTRQLEAALKDANLTKTRSISIRPGVGNTKSLVLTLWNSFIRLASIPINYIVLLIDIVTCLPNQIFIFNIPLIPSVETFFLWIIRVNGAVSVGILHNHIPSHGEKKPIRNYRYFEFYNYCDIVVFHDSSISEIFQSIFPNAVPLYTSLPSYSVPNASDNKTQKIMDSEIIKLGFMGTIRPYKNLEIISSEFKLLNKSQLSFLSLKITGKAFYDIDNMVRIFENIGFYEFVYNGELISDEKFFKEMSEYDFLLLPHANSSGSALLSVAASLGVPVIASNLTVFTDFVHRFGNGVIFDHLITGDLHRVVSKLIEDKILREKLKVNALRAVSSVPTWSNYVNDIFECCNELVTRRVQ